MSDSNHSDQPGEVTGAPESLLRFSCGNCGMELTAPLSAAGVEGPCPICGVKTAAPQAAPLPGSQPIPPQPPQRPGPESDRIALAEAGAAPPAHAVPERASPVVPPPVAPGQEPRQDHRRSRAPAAPVGPGSLAPARPAARGGRRRMKRAIDPHTMISADYESRKELGTIMRIFFAVLGTVAITWGVFHFMEKRFQAPPPEPEPEFPVNH